jgi:hypothetical protein
MMRLEVVFPQKKTHENEGHVSSSVLPSKMTVMHSGQNKGKFTVKV